jgi:hypothetical protein
MSEKAKGRPSSPHIQGEGDYEAARRHRKGAEEHGELPRHRRRRRVPRAGDHRSVECEQREGREGPVEPERRTDSEARKER